MNLSAKNLPPPLRLTTPDYDDHNGLDFWSDQGPSVRDADNSYTWMTAQRNARSMVFLDPAAFGLTNPPLASYPEFDEGDGLTSPVVGNRREEGTPMSPLWMTLSPIVKRPIVFTTCRMHENVAEGKVPRRLEAAQYDRRASVASGAEHQVSWAS